MVLQTMVMSMYICMIHTQTVRKPSHHRLIFQRYSQSSEGSLPCPSCQIIVSCRTTNSDLQIVAEQMSRAEAIHSALTTTNAQWCAMHATSSSTDVVLAKIICVGASRLLIASMKCKNIILKCCLLASDLTNIIFFQY